MTALYAPTAAPLAPRGSWLPHSDTVHAIVWLPDGKALVTSSEDGKLNAISATTGKAIGPYRGHRGPTNTACSTLDGKLVTGSDDHTVIAWDIAARTAIHRMKGHTGYVREVAAADRVAVSVSNDRSIRFWDLQTGKCTGSEDLPGEMIAVAITADGKRAASIGRDNALIIWDVATRKRTRVLYDAKARVSEVGGDLYVATKNTTGLGHVESPRRLIFIDGGRRLLSIGDCVMVWSVDTGKLEREFAPDGWGHDGASFDAKSGRLALCRNGASIWDVATGKRLAAMGDALYGFVAFSPDGSLLATGSSDGEIAVWDVASALTAANVDHVGGVTRIAARGTCGVTGGRDGRVLIWDLAAGGAPIEAKVAVRANGLPFELSPSGELLATATETGFDLWSTADGSLRLRVSDPWAEEPLVGEAHGFGFIDEKRLLVGFLGAGLGDLAIGKPRPVAFTGETKQVSEILVSSDRAIAITNGFFAKSKKSMESLAHLQCWDLNNRALVWTQAERGGQIIAYRMTSTGYVLCSLVKGKVQIEVFDRKNVSKHKLRIDETWLHTLAMLPGDVLLAAYGMTVYRIDCKKGVRVSKVEMSASSAESSAFSLDGTRIAIAAGSSVVVCATEDGSQIATFPTKATCKVCAFSDDGTRVIAGDEAGLVYVIEVSASSSSASPSSDRPRPSRSRRA